MRALVLVLALMLVNVPAAHEAWTDHRIDADGRDVTATVLASRTVDGRHLLDYRLPEDVDPDARRFSAAVDERTFERAAASRQVAVRVLPGQPGAHRVEGEVSSPVLLLTALGADLIALLLLGLWLVRRRQPPTEE